MITALVILLAYLLGSVSGSLLLGRFRHVDIRSLGSGNAGGTNAFRTQGFRFALGVVLIDVGKGVAATALLPLLVSAPAFGPAALVMACGFAAVLGHCYPLFHGFRGGKGAATAVGALAVIQPWLLLPMLLCWLLVVLATGYVGLATVLAGLSLAPAVWWRGGADELLIFCALLALFLLFTHRENMLRLARGTENRFERLRIANWFRSKS